MLKFTNKKLHLYTIVHSLCVCACEKTYNSILYRISGDIFIITEYNNTEN